MHEFKVAQGCKVKFKAVYSMRVNQSIELLRVFSYSKLLAPRLLISGPGGG